MPNMHSTAEMLAAVFWHRLMAWRAAFHRSYPSRLRSSGQPITAIVKLISGWWRPRSGGRAVVGQRPPADTAGPLPRGAAGPSTSSGRPSDQGAWQSDVADRFHPDPGAGERQSRSGGSGTSSNASASPHPGNRRDQPAPAEPLRMPAGCCAHDDPLDGVFRDELVPDDGVHLPGLGIAKIRILRVVLRQRRIIPNEGLEGRVLTFKDGVVIGAAVIEMDMSVNDCCSTRTRGITHQFAPFAAGGCLVPRVAISEPPTSLRQDAISRCTPSPRMLPSVIGGPAGCLG